MKIGGAAANSLFAIPSLALLVRHLKVARFFSEFTLPQTCKFLTFLQTGSFGTLSIEEQSLLGGESGENQLKQF